MKIDGCFHKDCVRPRRAGYVNCAFHHSASQVLYRARRAKAWAVLVRDALPKTLAEAGLNRQGRHVRLTPDGEWP